MTPRKGIILAGGNGTRLYPLTVTVNKHLMPVYDKPMIYYPLTTLMLAAIREILIITRPQDQPRFAELLGDGSQWGLEIQYQIQPHPGGIPEALTIGESFLNGAPSAVILGDNIFYGHGLTGVLESAAGNAHRATILAYQVSDPERYGIVEVDGDGLPMSLTEKPTDSASRLAVTGLYFLPPDAPGRAGQLDRSERGELEVLDLIRSYMDQGSLDLQVIHRGFAWLDAGTPESLLASAAFVRTVEERQGLVIASPEEVAVRHGFIDPHSLNELVQSMPESVYRRYLETLDL